MITNHDTISKFITIHKNIIQSRRVNNKHTMNINRSLKDPTDAIWLRINDIVNKYGLKFKGTFLVNINNLDKYLTRYNRAIRLRHLSHKWPKKDSDPTYWVKNPSYDIAAAEESASKYDNPIEIPAALISFLETSKESILTLAHSHNNYPNTKFDGRYPDLEWALSHIIHSRDKTLQACDKNLGGEIVDRTFHNTVCLEELTATDDYTELFTNENDRLNILHDFQLKILSLTNSNFTDNTHPIYKYLLQCQITTAAFSFTYPLICAHPSHLCY